MASRVVGIIPARYHSTRLPGKLLRPILGKTLLQWTYENAKKALSLDDLFVATYEEVISHHVQEFGGRYIYTHANCLNGTECVAAAIKAEPDLLNADVIINIQGDEPCLSKETIDCVVKVLLENPEASMATAVTKISTKEEALSFSIVKCVMDQKGRALYFSRQLLPSGKMQGWKEDFPYFRHIGIYAYRPSFLQELVQLPATPLQLQEDLEQLKVLEYGYQIQVAQVATATIGVDVPEDIKKVEQWLCKQNTFLLQEGSAPHWEKD